MPLLALSSASTTDRGLPRLLHEELHWLDVPQRVQLKFSATVHWCLQPRAPLYLMKCCIPLTDITCRQHLRSTSRQPLFVPRPPACDVRAFFVAGPMAWNNDSVRDPTRSFARQFSAWLKNFFFLSQLAYTAHQRLSDYALL